MGDPLFWALCANHMDLITPAGRARILPVPHPIAFRKYERVFRKRPTFPRVMPPTPGRDGRISLDEIMKQVSVKHGFTRAEILSQCRNAKVCFARHEFCYRAAVETLNSYPKIGQFLAGRDHSSIINSIRFWCQRHNLPRPRGITEAPHRWKRDIVREGAVA